MPQLKKFRGHLVTLPYMLFTTSPHIPLSTFPKKQLWLIADEDEPEMDCFEIAETYEEAQEAMQYRNHLPS